MSSRRPGWLEGGLCTGFEKLIMDADRLGGYQKLLGEGFDTSDEAWPATPMARSGPGGHFLGCGHTMRTTGRHFTSRRFRQREYRKLDRGRVDGHAPPRL